MARELYLDIENQTFVRDPQSGAPLNPANLFEGDIPDYELYFVRPGESGAPPYRYVDKQDAAVKLHIGPPPPSTATAYVAQDTWTNIAGSLSGVTVGFTRVTTGGAGTNEQQQITFDPAPESGVFNLSFPQRTLAITAFSDTQMLGSSGQVNPIAIFKTVTAHGLTTGDPIVLSGFTAPSGFSNGVLYYAVRSGEDTFFLVDGASFLLSATAATSGAASAIVQQQTTESIDVRNIDALTIKEALEATPATGVVNSFFASVPNKGNFGVFVEKIGPEFAPEKINIIITFQGTKSRVSFPLLQLGSNSTALQRRAGKKATLNFNTVELANAISGRATLDAVLEVQTTDDGKIDTVAQLPVVLRKELITGNSPVPVSTISGSASFSILSPDSSVWVVTIDNDGILTASKL
jgi:hypothetical protein